MTGGDAGPQAHFGDGVRVGKGMGRLAGRASAIVPVVCGENRGGAARVELGVEDGQLGRKIHKVGDDIARHTRGVQGHLERGHNAARRERRRQMRGVCKRRGVHDGGHATKRDEDGGARVLGRGIAHRDELQARGGAGEALEKVAIGGLRHNGADEMALA